MNLKSNSPTLSIRFAKFLTDQNFEMRQSILDGILDEKQNDYLDDHCCIKSVLNDFEICTSHASYCYKLNINALIVIKSLLLDEQKLKCKIHSLNKNLF